MKLQTILLGAFLLAVMAEGVWYLYQNLKRQAKRRANDRQKTKLYPELIEAAKKKTPEGQAGEGVPIGGKNCCIK